MRKIIPFFEVDGKRYEINRTRYLIAEYDKLGEQSSLSNTDKENGIKAQSLIGDIQKYGEKAEQFWKKLEENPSKENRDAYYMFKEMYDNALNQLAKLETETGSTQRLQKEAIDMLEKIAIKGLAEQYFNFDENKALAIWEKHAETIGNNATVEWLTAMSDCLFKEDEEIEDNSFLSQMRKMAEERANSRKKAIGKR